MGLQKNATESGQWHALEPDEVLRRLHTNRDGLADDEVTRRRAEFGPNTLDLARPTSAWKILVDQFRGVVIALLAVAAIVAWWLGDPADAMAILAVLLINATLGFVTELRARRAMDALRALEVPRAVVVRNGATHEIAARDLVPGDVIELESGQSVPADARLIASTDVRVNESALTGESLPVGKDARAPVARDAVLAERATMLYQATTVVAGTARAVVTATGNRTEAGRIGVMTSGIIDERTPLERRLDALGKRLVWLALAVAGVVALLGLLRGEPTSLVLQTAIALAIAAVPEGLPAVATITLAVGVARMARRRALVRRLPAVETLGSATVVCTDKTGTLTAGRMAVTTIVTGDQQTQVTGVGYEPEGEFRRDDAPITPLDDALLRELLVAGALANRAGVSRDDDGTWHATGDPTEAALLVAARKAGLDRAQLEAERPEIGEIPFSSERQYMATLHRASSGAVLFVKGAPRELVGRSTRLAVRGGVPVPLDDAGRRTLLDWNERLAGKGLRVLAFATRAFDRADMLPGDDQARDLTFLGFVGIEDPPAPDVRDAIRLFHDAGIRTVMITGDQRLTAISIARDLGIVDEQEDIEALDGRALAEMEREELRRRLDAVRVFYRVSPADKLRIVESLQSRGAIVAMLGDGVNDAAALKKADIGVAMGVRGTDIARQASDVVLADDRFPTVAAAVEEGRVIFDNIRKFVFYLFSCNIAEVFVLLIAGVVGLPQPLLPLQILWLNIVTDTFPALALAVEPGEPDVMQRPPRDPQRAILSRAFIQRIATYGALIAGTTLGAFLWTIERGDASRAVTVAFMTLALAQAFHLGNARSAEPVLAPWRIVSNKWAIAAIALVLALQVVALHVRPVADLLRVTPLGVAEWVLVLVASLLPAVVGQLLKLRRHKPV